MEGSGNLREAKSKEAGSGRGRTVGDAVSSNAKRNFRGQNAGERLGLAPGQRKTGRPQTAAKQARKGEGGRGGLMVEGGK